MGASRAVTLGAVAAVAISGCGGGGSTGSEHNTQVISTAEKAAASEQSIKQALLRLPGARPYQDAAEYLAPGEDPSDLNTHSACSVVVILASPQEVATYKGDDAVVTNPEGTVGVKVVGSDADQAGCLREAANMLKGFK
jgi:hypothetical protein